MKFDFLLKSKRFPGPPIDEVALHQAAKLALTESKSSIEETLKALTGKNTDLATCILYHHLQQSRHGDFIRALDAMPQQASPESKKIKVLILPGMFYSEYPEVGSDGQLIRTIFENNGYEVSMIRTQGRGSISTNKEIIKTALREEKHEKVWLVSLSKGSAEVRAALQELSLESWPDSLQGWVNFSGIFSGSILAEHRTNTLWKRIFLRLICRLGSVDYQLILELSPKHGFWRQKPHFAKNLHLIHLLGFPLLSHAQPVLAHRFLALSKHGPTDGTISLLDAVNYPGHVYPVWGCDHFARSPNLSALLYQLCHYISALPARQKKDS